MSLCGSCPVWLNLWRDYTKAGDRTIWEWAKEHGAHACQLLAELCRQVAQPHWIRAGRLHIVGPAAREQPIPKATDRSSTKTVVSLEIHRAAEQNLRTAGLLRCEEHGCVSKHCG